MLFFVIGIVLQAILVVHVIKTGRNTIWIWVIVLLSWIGCVAYVAAELIPELLRTRTATRASRGVKRAIDPGKPLRDAADRMSASGNVASKQEYADELVRQGRAAEAIPTYREALSGLYEHDPKLMLGLANALFETGDYAGASTTLDDLMKFNPDFRSPDGHLLYARAVEAQGDVAKALEEYKILAGYYPGAEAAVRYARLLRDQGRQDEARRVLRELLDVARVAPAHYRKTQREWLSAAEGDQKIL